MQGDKYKRQGRHDMARVCYFKAVEHGYRPNNEIKKYIDDVNISFPLDHISTDLASLCLLPPPNDKSVIASGYYKTTAVTYTL